MISIRTKAFGIDISTSSVKVAEVEKIHNKIQLSSFAEASIPVSALVAGVIRQPDTVRRALEPCLAQMKGLRKGKEYVVCSIPDDKVYMQEGTFPKLTNDKLREAIQFKIQTFIPLPLNDVYWDYTIVSENKDNTLQVLIAAAERETVDSYYDVLKKLHLIPIVFQNSAMLSTLVLPLPSDKRSLLIDIGKTQTTLSLIEESFVKFSATVHLGLNQIIKEYDELFHIEDDKSIQLLKENGIDTKNEELNQKLKQLFDPLRQEITRVMNFQEGKEVNAIYLFGEGSTTKGIKEILGQGLTIPIQQERSTVITASNIDSANITPVLGAAYYHLQKNIKKSINFLPQKAYKDVVTTIIKEKIFWGIRITAMIMLAYITIFVMFIAFLNIYQQYLYQKLTSLQSIGTQQQYLSKGSQITNDNRYIQQLLLANQFETNWLPYLEEIPSLTPSGISLTSYSIAQKNPGWDITISGSATNRQVLLSYLQELEFNSKYLQQVTLPISDIQQDQTVNFSITATIQKI